MSARKYWFDPVCGEPRPVPVPTRVSFRWVAAVVAVAVVALLVVAVLRAAKVALIMPGAIR